MATPQVTPDPKSTPSPEEQLKKLQADRAKLQTQADDTSSALKAIAGQIESLQRSIQERSRLTDAVAARKQKIEDEGILEYAAQKAKMAEAAIGEAKAEGIKAAINSYDSDLGKKEGALPGLETGVSDASKAVDTATAKAGQLKKDKENYFQLPARLDSATGRLRDYRNRIEKLQATDLDGMYLFANLAGMDGAALQFPGAAEIEQKITQLENDYQAAAQEAGDARVKLSEAKTNIEKARAECALLRENRADNLLKAIHGK